MKRKSESFAMIAPTIINIVAPNMAQIIFLFPLSSFVLSLLYHLSSFLVPPWSLLFPRSSFLLPRSSFLFARSSFLVPGTSLPLSLSSFFFLCTTRYDSVLQGKILYYNVRLCTTRYDHVLQGKTLYYRVRLCVQGTTLYVLQDAAIT